MNNFSIPLITLLSAAVMGMPVSTVAATDSAQVLVRATVPSWVRLETDASVDLGNESNKESSHTVTVYSNNTNQITRISVSQEGSSENHLVLNHTDASKNDKMAVKVDIKEPDIKDGEFTSGRIDSKNFATSQAGKKMTLLLTPTSDFSKLESGSYQGTLSIQAEVD